MVYQIGDLFLSFILINNALIQKCIRYASS